MGPASLVPEVNVQAARMWSPSEQSWLFTHTQLGETGRAQETGSQARGCEPHGWGGKVREGRQCGQQCGQFWSYSAGKRRR